MVDALYRNGLVDFQNVLDMQRSLVSQQDSAAESQGFVVQDFVMIYKALGGGWAPPEDGEGEEGEEGVVDEAATSAEETDAAEDS